MTDGQVFGHPAGPWAGGARPRLPAPDGGDPLGPPVGSGSTPRGLEGVGARYFSVDDTGNGRLALWGELDLATVPDLDEALQCCVGDVTLDCQKLVFLDSTGLSVLMKHERRLRAAGSRLTLEGIQPACRRILEVTGLDTVLGVPADG